MSDYPRDQQDANELHERHEAQRRVDLVPQDEPGLNPIQLAKIQHAVKRTCATYQPSIHGNAYERKNGEDAICVNCGSAQWRHWLKILTPPEAP